MGLESVNAYQYPEYKFNNHWGLNAGAIGPVKPSEEIYTPPVEYTGGNLFAGSYSGINENLGIGSKIYYAPQAGVDRTGTTICIG